MADEPINLVLEIVRAIRGDTADIRGTLRDHGYRLNRIEIGIAGLRRNQAQDAEHVAHVGVDLDGLRERVARIEARLDIHDA